MLAELACPVELNLAHIVVFLGEHRLCLGIDAAQTGNIKRRHTVVGTEVTLRVAVQRVAEHGTQVEALAQHIGRLYAYIKECILGTVLVVAIGIVKDSRGVSQRVLAAQLREDIVVVGVERRGHAVVVALIGSHDRRLDQSQGDGRYHRACREVLGHAIVEQVVVGARDRDVELGLEVPQDVDVGIETHVHSLERVLACRIVGIDIAYGEVVHTDIIATLHIDVVVLGDGSVIDLLAPVGIVVILVNLVPQTLGVGVQEMEVDVFLNDAVDGAQHLGSIAAILAGVHHRGQRRHKGETSRHVGIDTRSHRMTALGLNQYHTVATTCTVEGCAILQHRHLLNVIRGDVGQHVEVLTVVQGGAVTLHIQFYAIDHNQRHGIGSETVHTTDEHSSTTVESGRTHDGAHVCTQFLAYLAVDGHTTAFHLGLALCRIGGSRTIHRQELVLQHTNLNLLCLVAGNDSHLLRQILRGMHIESRSKRRHRDGKSTILLGHCRIAYIAQGLQLNTRQGLTGSQIGDDTLDGDYRIICLSRLSYRLLDSGFHLIFFVILALSQGRSNTESECQCAEKESPTRHLPIIKYSALHLHLFFSSYSTSSTGFRMTA